METLGVTKFDRCAIEISLINICNQESYVGQEMRKLYNAWKEETAETVNNPWLDLHQFSIYIPHPEQQYEDVTLEEGLTKGYNIEVEPVKNRSEVPYQIPEGGHFVIVLKQKALDADFSIAATGIFIRPLGVLSLDLVIDPEKGEYRPLIVKHPIIRDYPKDWEKKLVAFLNQEIASQDLPNLVGYVDRAINQDYRPPSWNDIYLSAAGFAGF
jgi:hypothetical protein